MKSNKFWGAEFHRCYRSVFSHHHGTVSHDNCAGLSEAKIAAAENLVNTPAEGRLCSHLALHRCKPSGHQAHERENNSLEALLF
jgi:hypothetical protein